MERHRIGRSLPGDVITVTPGELHDGHPVDGAVRRWRIIYFDATALSRQFMQDVSREIEFVSPSLTDQKFWPLGQPPVRRAA